MNQKEVRARPGGIDRMGEMNPRLVFSDEGISPRANLAFGLKILTMLQTRLLGAAWVKEQLQRAS